MATYNAQPLPRRLERLVMARIGDATMDKAIEILRAMLKELESDAKATYESREYYDRIDAKISAVEEAIERLEYKKGEAP